MVKKNPSKPTLEAIAHHAGVSRGTVDRVLHNRPNVKAEKRERVLSAIRELNYSPNTAARALALKDKGAKIAVLLPPWSGHFENEIKRGIEAAIADSHDFGVDVIIYQCKSDLPEECIEKIDELLEMNISGLALCAKNSVLLRDQIRTLQNKTIPVITFNSDIPDSGRMCFVGENYTRSGRTAAEIMSKCIPVDTELLIVAGNLAFDSHRGRVDGFCQRFSELGRFVHTNHIVESYNEYDLTYEKVHSLLEKNRNFRGIYMANESVPGCVDAVEALGKSKMIHIVCHDLPSYTLRYLKEGRVDFSIGQNIFRQGYQPISLLQNYIIADKIPENIANPPLLIFNAENIPDE